MAAGPDPCNTHGVSTSSLSDDLLVRHAASGDGAAFEGIYERYHQPLYRYALSILREPQDAQDTLQSTMERAFRSIGNQRVGGGLRAWLFGIAHNEAMDTLKRRRGTPPPDAQVLAASAASDAAERERMRQLVADLGTLPERQRSALVLRELSGLDSEEIAGALAISPSAANQSVYEARVALTALVEGRDMSCDRVQQKISAGDGRRLRGRRLKAHVRDCVVCQSFTAGIGMRSADFPCLFPPLAAAAAAKTFAAVTGGTAVLGAGGGGGAASVNGVQGAAEGPARGASESTFLRDRRAATAAVGVIALLTMGGALGAIRSADEPAPSKAVSAEPAGAPTAARPSAPGPKPPATPAKKASPASVAPSTVSGYTALDPNVTNLLASDGSGDDVNAANGAGSRSDGGSSDSADGGALAFTGLDLLLLIAAGLGLLVLGLGMRQAATRPSAP